MQRMDNSVDAGAENVHDTAGFSWKSTRTEDSHCDCSNHHLYVSNENFNNVDFAGQIK